jgi:hypothetical protein
LANGARARLLAYCRAALDQEAAVSETSPEHLGDGEEFLNLLPDRLRLCPHCKQGLLRCIQVLERPPPVQWWA